MQETQSKFSTITSTTTLRRTIEAFKIVRYRFLLRRPCVEDRINESNLAQRNIAPAERLASMITNI